MIPPNRPAIPDVRGRDWVRNTIDRFLLARMEARGVSPSPEADRVTLIRRLTGDLTGLPPTPEEVDAFVADARPDAYERLVDRLHRGTLLFGRRGLGMFAISGVEIALWDLAGQARGVPVYELLGGLAQPRIPAYASLARFETRRASS